MAQTLDYNYLSQQGVLGLYQSCKIETIYAHNKNSNEILVLFSRVHFMEEEVSYSNRTHNFKYKYKSPSSTEFNFGIFIQFQNLLYAEKLFNSLKINKWVKHHNLSIVVEDLNEIPARYIKANSKYVKPWNKNSYSEILGIKSDYEKINNGCYILEFANLEKSSWNFLFEKKLELHLSNIQKEVSLYSDIKIQSYPDKIGNIIFQFPIKLLKLTRLKEDCKVKMIYDNRFENPDCILIFNIDNIEKTSSTQVSDCPTDNVIVFDNNKVPVKVTIYDKNKNIIIAETDNCLYQKPSAGIGGSFSIHNDRNRTIQLNEVTEIINPTFSNPTFSKLTFRDWFEFRKHEIRKIKERNKVIFKTYYNNNNNRQQSHLAAIEELKYLINEHGQFGVYIIDPFIEYSDILNTIYFCKWGGVSFKIIGGMNGVDSLKKYYKRNDILYRISNYLNNKFKSINIPTRNCLKEWKEDQKNQVKTLSNNFGIDLEFRIPYKISNQLLHDRFIIFPYNYQYKRARVWSIGTSINSIGKNFHVITELNDGEIILDQFMDLWVKLNNNDEHLVLKINPSRSA